MELAEEWLVLRAFCVLRSSSGKQMRHQVSPWETWCLRASVQYAVPEDTFISAGKFYSLALPRYALGGETLLAWAALSAPAAAEAMLVAICASPPPMP